jgi:hypothetical protein
MRAPAAFARPDGSARGAQAGVTAVASPLGLALASNLDRLTPVRGSDPEPSGAAVVVPAAAAVSQPAPTWHGQVTPPRLPSVTPWAGGG